jgi:AcrR family transcriptional regulator
MMRAGPDKLTLSAIASEAGLTAGALVQRFGSKRALMLAHARFAATTGDLGLSLPTARVRSPLQALRMSADVFAQLAPSPEAALRNLAYLQRDLADPALYGMLLAMNRQARKDYARLISDAVAARELLGDINAHTFARTVEAALIGSFVAWTIHRKGPASTWIRRELDAVLRPYRANGSGPARVRPTV